MTTLSAILFKRALNEDLDKRAFVPLDKKSQQAMGPDGAPVDPNAAAAGGAPSAGAAPMDPSTPPAPMDPSAAGGAPPADPSADPAAAGALPPPPADPAADPAAAAGAPPADPSMMPPPEMPPEQDVNSPDTDVNNDGKPDTMVPLSGMKDFAIGLIEAMKGKKTQEAEAAAAGGAGGAGADAPPPPGPITGMPADMSSLAGPMAGVSSVTGAPKTAAIIGRQRKV